MGLGEKAANYQYCWWDMQMSCLLDLTLMAGANKPPHIVDQHWPPEAEEQASPDCEDTFVPEVIVGLLN